MDYAAEVLLRKLSAEKAWSTIEKLAQYEDELWNDPVIPEEGSLDYKNPDIEQLLGVMKYKVDALIKNAISLMGRSKGVFRMESNEMYQIPPEPSRQEDFEHIVMNFILDQKERVKQLKEYIRVIMDDFMQLSSEVIRRLKEKIIEEGSRIRKFKKITKYLDIKVLKPLAGHKFSESFELVLEFFASFEFEASTCRVGLYTERKSRDNTALSGLSRVETVKENCLLIEFWPSIGDGGFNVGTTNVASIRNPGVKLSHRCIAPYRVGRKVTIGSPRFTSTTFIASTRKGLFATSLIGSLTVEEDEAEEEAKWEAANMGVGGSAEMYRNMSQGVGRFVKHDGWTNKTNAGSNLMLRKDNRRRNPTGCTTTLFVNSNTCPLDTTLSPTSISIHSSDVKLITIPMATMDTCLQVMHTVLTHPMIALLDYLCLMMYSLVTFIVKQLWIVIA
ncbi:hypothetical protein Tco_0994246 [Tanacetum coccineum]